MGNASRCFSNDIASNITIKHLEKIGIFLMLFPIFYYGDIWINDSEPKLLALIGVSLIILSNSENTFLSKVLNFKPFALVGLSSYSIYLLHQPIFAFYRVFVNNFNFKFNSYWRYFISIF